MSLRGIQEYIARDANGYGVRACDHRDHRRALFRSHIIIIALRVTIKARGIHNFILATKSPIWIIICNIKVVFERSMQSN